MVDSFVGEIRIFAGSTAPTGWAFCNGDLLQVSQYQELYALVGTTYGGDGTTNFALPDLRGRVPIHKGSGPNLSPRALASKGGQETVSLNTTQIPSHSHTPRGSDTLANSDNPAGNVLAKRNQAFYKTNPTSTKIIALPSNVVDNTGSGTAHANMQPYLGVNFIISLQGVFPNQN